MQILLLKSIVSLGVLLLTGIALFTMFEVLGRSEKRFDVERMKRLHRLNGLLFIIITAFIAALCIRYIRDTGTGPSPRGSLHSLLAMTVFVLLGFKIAFVSFYRQFYAKAQTVGMLIAGFTILAIGTSAGFHLLTRKSAAPPLPAVQQQAASEPGILVRTDPESIARGKELYEAKCYFCHDAYSTRKEVGPGHKGILKHPLLPVSRKPATPENVAAQIRTPYRDMPAFSYLGDEEVMDLIAFLNTL